MSLDKVSRSALLGLLFFLISSPANEAAIRTHRIQVDPILSFLIRGVEGSYEYRFPGTYLTIDVPFTFAYNSRSATSDYLLILGSGFGINKFLNHVTRGSHINLHCHYKQFHTRSVESPMLSSLAEDDTELKHNVDHLLYFSLMWGYRWQSPTGRFFFNFNLGPTYLMVMDVPGPHNDDFQMLFPMAQFLVGYAVF